MWPPSKDHRSYEPGASAARVSEWIDPDESRGDRARRLLAQSWSVVREDRRLWAYPAVAATVSLLTGAAAFVLSTQVTGGGHFRRTMLLAGIIVSYPVTFTSLFCGVALAAALRASLAGESFEAGCGWRAARERAGIIAGWTFLACTVGALIRVTEEYLPLGGKIVALVLDLTWSLATLFIVPVIAYERVGPREALRRSSEIFRARWGEQVAGGIAIGAGAWFVSLPFVMLIVGGASAPGAAGVACLAVGGAGLLATAAVTTALEQVFRLFVYRYATGVEAGASTPFRTADLERPFSAKRRWGR